MNEKLNNVVFEPVSGIEIDAVFDLPLAGPITLCCNTTKKIIKRLDLDAVDNSKEEILKCSSDIFLRYKTPENYDELEILSKHLHESELLLNYLLYPRTVGELFITFDNIMSKGLYIIYNNELCKGERGREESPSYLSKFLAMMILKDRADDLAYHYTQDRRDSPISRQIRIAVELFNHSIRSSDKATGLLDCVSSIGTIVDYNTAKDLEDNLNTLLKSRPFIWPKDPALKVEKLLTIFHTSYDNRSKILHQSGLGRDVSDEEVKNIQYLAYNMIYCVSSSVRGNPKLDNQKHRKKHFLKEIKPATPYFAIIPKLGNGKTVDISNSLLSFGVDGVHFYYLDHFDHTGQREKDDTQAAFVNSQ